MNTAVNGERKPRWLSPRAISSSSSSGKSRRICSSAFGGTIRSRGGRTSRLDRHLHLRKTMAVGRDHAHHLRLELPQHAVEDRPAFLGGDSERRMRDQLLKIAGADPPTLVELDVWKAGNSSRGSPRILKCDRPQSSVTRCSPAAAILTGAGGSSRAISLSFLAGIVIAPGVSTSAATSVVTAMSRSVPDRRIPLSVVSTRIFARTGKCRLRRNARGHCGKTFLQLFPGDRKPHHGSYGVQKLGQPY